MSLQEVERRLGTDLRPERFGMCTMAFFGSGAVEDHGIFWKGRLGSLWFERGARAARGGIRICSRLSELRRAYELVSIRGDYYLPPTRNVFVRRERPPHWRLRVDVSPAGRVTRIAFGN